ncbi:MAG: hypothetical protein KAS39_03285, partial [Actinomycetia bacterium]|nr:hypothetical protein [Actinomycetes bacterium]
EDGFIVLEKSIIGKKEFPFTQIRISHENNNGRIYSISDHLILDCDYSLDKKKISGELEILPFYSQFFEEKKYNDIPGKAGASFNFTTGWDNKFSISYNGSLNTEGIFEKRSLISKVDIKGNQKKVSLSSYLLLDNKKLTVNGYTGKKSSLILSTEGIRLFGKKLKGQIRLKGNLKSFDFKIDKFSHNKTYIDEFYLRFIRKDSGYILSTLKSTVGVYIDGNIIPGDMLADVKFGFRRFYLRNIPFSTLNSGGYLAGDMHLSYFDKDFEVKAKNIIFRSGGFIKKLSTAFTLNNNELLIDYIKMSDGEDPYFLKGKVTKLDDILSPELFFNFDETDYQLSGKVKRDGEKIKGDILINNFVNVDFKGTLNNFILSVRLNSVNARSILN